MNKPLPEVACNKCWKRQQYRSQKACLHCGKELVASPPWTGKK